MNITPGSLVTVYFDTQPATRTGYVLTECTMPDGKTVHAAPGILFLVDPTTYQYIMSINTRLTHLRITVH